MNMPDADAVPSTVPNTSARFGLNVAPLPTSTKSMSSIPSMTTHLRLPPPVRPLASSALFGDDRSVPALGKDALNTILPLGGPISAFTQKSQTGIDDPNPSAYSWRSTSAASSAMSTLKGLAALASDNVS